MLCCCVGVVSFKFSMSSIGEVQGVRLQGYGSAVTTSAVMCMHATAAQGKVLDDDSDNGSDRQQLHKHGADDRALNDPEKA